MTGIEWTDATWNPTTGCDKVSLGCDNCYALTMANRLKLMGQPRYQTDGNPRTSGPGFGLTLQHDQLTLPERLKQPRRIFVNSMSDLFHPDVPVDFILSVWETMARTPRHTYQILTKRPERMRRIVDAIASIDEPLPNVWLGTSIESDRYVWRANHLQETPAAVRFLSLEPLLGPLPSLSLAGIGWVIIGAESGAGARPMNNTWALDLVERCKDAAVPVFVKQLSGGRHPIKNMDQFPYENLKVRAYPQ